MSIIRTALFSYLCTQLISATDSSTIWLNEWSHSGNAEGVASANFVEIAGPAGTELTDSSVFLYGADGKVIKELRFEADNAVIPDQANGFGAVSISIPNNLAAPNGIALLTDSSRTVVDFVSFKGSIAATEGPAVGMNSVDIDTQHIGNGQGVSIQRCGQGTDVTHFKFLGHEITMHSNGQINDCQHFASSPMPRRRLEEVQNATDAPSGSPTIAPTVFATTQTPTAPTATTRWPTTPRPTRRPTLYTTPSPSTESPVTSTTMEPTAPTVSTSTTRWPTTPRPTRRPTLYTTPSPSTESPVTSTTMEPTAPTVSTSTTRWPTTPRPTRRPTLYTTPSPSTESPVTSTTMEPTAPTASTTRWPTTPRPTRRPTVYTTPSPSTESPVTSTTMEPTMRPSEDTEEPTPSPSGSPTTPSVSPTAAPSTPTLSPTVPTAGPTEEPTMEPTSVRVIMEPTYPTLAPTPDTLLDQGPDPTPKGRSGAVRNGNGYFVQIMAFLAIIFCLF